MIGHPEARRELTENGWAYPDADNHSMAVDLVLRGVSLPEIDQFIEQLEAEGVGAGEELRERRRKAYEAFCRGRYEQFERHIEWILNRKREIGGAEKAQPYVDDGIKKRAVDKKKSAKMVRLSKGNAAGLNQRNKTICKEYAELQERGVPGADVKVGRRHNLAAKTVRNIVSAGGKDRSQ